MKPIENSLVSRLSEQIDKLFCRKRKHPDLATEMMRIMPTAQLQTNRAEPREELLLRFFREEPDEAIRHPLSAVAQFSDDEMERYHDFIQWIFPTIRRSDYHPLSLVISPQFADKLFSDACALRGYCKGCKHHSTYNLESRILYPEVLQNLLSYFGGNDDALFRLLALGLQIDLSLYSND